MPMMLAMGRRSRRSKDPVTQAAQVVSYPWRVKSKVNDFIRPAMRVLGVAGLGMVAGCVVLWSTPAEQWPRWLDPGLLPVYAMISLSVASLLGWTFVNDGQTRIRRKIGAQASLWAFVILPISFAIAGFIGAARFAAVGGPPPWHWFWDVVHWYGPLLAVASLWAFLSWKSRGRFARGAWFGILVAPYAILLAFLVFGLPITQVDAAHHATLRSLGTWAVALQFVLGYFVGG
jgi:hypothetical protein